jgi:hypothetical protein
MKRALATAHHHQQQVDLHTVYTHAGRQHKLTRLWEGGLQQKQRMIHQQQIIIIINSSSSIHVAMHAVYTLCRLQEMAGHDLQPLCDTAVFGQLVTACSRSCCVAYLAL